MMLRKPLLFLFSHRCLAIARWDLYFLRVRFWNAITLQTIRIRKFLSTRERPMFLNLGSGPRGIDDPHWVNVDGFRDRNVHFLLDVSRRLPFADRCFDGVFCEHLLEHLSLEDGEILARELCRILGPGRCLRIVVPDAELIMRSYFDAPNELVAWRGCAKKTPMEVVNSYFRQRYEHQFLYDWTIMEKMLYRAGFNKILRVSFKRAEMCQPIMLDDQKYEWESLYVEAQKQ